MLQQLARDEPAAPQPAAVGDGSLTISGTAPVAPPGGVTIVLLEPHGTIAATEQESPPVMDQASLAFLPGVLLVRTGQPVSFQNHDSELHNVNVFEDATKEQAFNIALLNGGSYLHTFGHDGFYSVRCDVHPAMSADIMATSSPYATIADLDGRFSFDRVHPGAYTATIYASGRRIQQEITIDASRTDLTLGEP